MAHSKWTLGIIAWLCFSLSSVHSLKVTTSLKGFIVYIDDIPLIDHSDANPLCAIGRSRSDFVENQGNFIIEDVIEEQIEMPLFAASLSGLPSKFVAIMSNAAYPGISVNVTIVEKPSLNFRTAVHIEVSGSGRDRLWFRLSSNESEKLYGGGEQYTYLNLKGRDYPMWTREQGVGRNRSSPLAAIVEAGSPGAAGNYHTTYYPIPMFMSNFKYVVQGNQDRYSVLKFSDPKWNEFYVHDIKLSLDVGTADSFLSLVGAINRIASKVPPTLPEWIYNGAIIASQGGTQNMLDKVQLCDTYGVNVSAFWIQDWSGKIQTSFGYRVFWNWRWNETFYPGLDTVVSDLSSRGIQVTVYINPHLNTEGQLFKEAESLGYLLKDANNETYKENFGEFLAGTMDFSNPLAKKWYSELIKSNIIQPGFKGFMADFGEYTPLDAVAINSADPYQFHNQLPVLWASTVRMALEESGTLNTVLPWARSGFTGAQQYHSIMWAGDQNVDWTKSDGLPSSIIAALSLGLSGYGLSHSDIGGYTTLDGILTRSEELLLRWAEYSAFTPLMRTHEGNKPDLNYQIFSSNETLKNFGRLTAIYSSLAPYHKEIVQLVSTEGLPAMRPLFIHYPNDLETFETEYEYLYGSDLLIAPVLEPSVSTWTVYLPSDNWIHLWDVNQVIINGPKTITVESVLGKPPVFYRSSSKWASLFSSIEARFNF